MSFGLKLVVIDNFPGDEIMMVPSFVVEKLNRLAREHMLGLRDMAEFEKALGELVRLAVPKTVILKNFEAVKGAKA